MKNSKPKFKIGTLVEFTDNSLAQALNADNIVHGVVEREVVDGVLVTMDGVSYRVNGTRFVNESDIFNSYRPVTLRRKINGKKTLSTSPKVGNKKTAARETQATA